MMTWEMYCIELENMFNDDITVKFVTKVRCVHIVYRPMLNCVIQLYENNCNFS